MPYLLSKDCFLTKRKTVVLWIQLSHMDKRYNVH
uniref:Uncharacterized protein n=1 Tax=Arundo donax TaxID=35708 RepID=A0A0A9BEG6_ARUDO